MTPTELQGFWSDVRDVAAAVRQVFEPVRSTTVSTATSCRTSTATSSPGTRTRTRRSPSTCERGTSVCPTRSTTGSLGSWRRACVCPPGFPNTEERTHDDAPQAGGFEDRHSGHPRPVGLARLDGFPRVTPLWFLYADGAFYMTSAPDKPHVGGARRNRQVKGWGPRRARERCSTETPTGLGRMPTRGLPPGLACRGGRPSAMTAGLPRVCLRSPWWSLAPLRAEPVEQRFHPQCPASVDRPVRCPEPGGLLGIG